jgi:hypothetical protein
MSAERVGLLKIRIAVHALDAGKHFPYGDFRRVRAPCYAAFRFCGLSSLGGGLFFYNVIKLDAIYLGLLPGHFMRYYA